MKIYKLVVCALVLVFAAIPVFASNITIADDNNRNPIVGVGQGGEDNETEPGMVLSQDWDLEGFFLEKDSLSMVGGFDFIHGFRGYDSGDIFISTSGNAPVYGDIDRDPNADTNGHETVSNTYGYDYVFDLNVTELNYKVYAINSATQLVTAYYDENEGSSPWQFNLDDNIINDVSVAAPYSFITSGEFGFVNDGSDYGFDGMTYTNVFNDVHYSLTGFDLSFLDHGTEFYSHFTMGCGNDNLMGRGTVVPEPATMLLLGSGLVGLGFYRRRMKK